LGTYSGFLGPIAGVLICDYWVCRRTKLNLRDLYLVEGEYKYFKGFNIKAIVALVLGVVVAVIGELVPSLHFLFDYAWFVGFAVSFFAYWAMTPPKPEKVEKPAATRA
jgi:NCS1 family nucleobase:cation symporter-1